MANFTREELEENKKQLTEEVEKLEKIIQASDTSTFEIMIEDIKNEMFSNVSEENWKMLKQNRVKVEQFRNIVKIIQAQDELLEEKKNELEDVQWKLDHFQLDMFENKSEVEETEKTEEYVSTGYIENGSTICTGDVWKEHTPKVDGEPILYTVIKSAELEGSFAIIGNTIEGERLLQYPNNLSMLKGCSYVGNIFLEDDDQENALKSFDLILSTRPKVGDEGEEE